MLSHAVLMIYMENSKFFHRKRLVQIQDKASLVRIHLHIGNKTKKSKPVGGFP